MCSYDVEDLRMYFRPDTMLCAIAKKEESCIGNGGSPLIMTKTEEQGDIVVGINSWSGGYECKKPSTIIFTKVGAFDIRSWIDKIVQKNGQAYGDIQWVNPLSL